MKTFRLLRFDHLVIDTGNLRQSLEFYAELPGVGISVEKGRGIARIGDQKINIHEYPPTLAPVALHPVIGHQDFSLVYPGPPERFRESFPPLAPGCPDAREGGFFVRDPDGNRIGIEFDRASPPAAPRLECLTLPVADREASVRFYSRLLGLEVVQSENALYCRLGAGRIRLVTERSGLVGGAGDFCMVTDTNIEAVYRELEGAPLVPGVGIVVRHGALGPMRSIYLRDPEGNLVEIAEYAEKREIS